MPQSVYQFPLLICCEKEYMYGVGLPTMAINGLRNKPIGPGGSTRRLHHLFSQVIGGAKQDRRGRKSCFRRSVLYHRYRAIL